MVEKKATKVAKKAAKTNANKATEHKRAKKTAKKVTKRVAKKAAKRAVKSSVKPAAKPRASARPKVEVYKLAQDVPEDKYFILANGKPIKHVKELAEVLEHLEDHVFNHHVNPEQNDFHLWVREVFEDVQLAKKMLGISDKKKLQLAIYKHVADQAFRK